MTLFGPDPVADELERVLGRLAEGVVPGEWLESRHVDLKEEPGRRRHDRVLPPARENEEAAKVLAGESVCMANTPGGGVLVVGVADDGNLVGTALDGEWLRRRVYDLTQRELTVSVAEHDIGGTRLLLVRSPEAVRPIVWNRRYRHRVGDACVEIDPSSWETQRRQRIGYDWSALPSGRPVEQARASAIQRARDFLAQAGDERSRELAEARDGDLLRRLDVVTAEGQLTNAGAVAFVGRDVPAIEYVRREVSGGDSVQRIRQAGRGLLEELYDVDTAMSGANPVRHLPSGLVQRQVRLLPQRAVREAVVNGVAHRDWAVVEPTHVEHVGARLVVMSPGGFVGGVTPDNIITHPSQPRNRMLAELLARLHLAEREGIGVDRMVGDMIRLGYQPPSITQAPGPYVRTVLLGSSLDLAWMAFLDELRPAAAGTDLDSLLIVRHLVREWWVDVATAAPLMQRTPAEAADVLTQLADVRVSGVPVMEPVDGVPPTAPPAWQVTAAARQRLTELGRDVGGTRTWPERSTIARSWAVARGRVSSTELGSLVGAHSTNVQHVLKALEQQGVLAPGRANRRGAGFFYVPVEPSESGPVAGGATE